MLRSYKFYERELSYVSKEDIDMYYQIICDVEDEFNQGIINEDKIRLLNNEIILKMIIMEGKMSFLREIIKPFPYRDGEVTRYRYLIDLISTGVYDYIRRLPFSIMEAYMEARKEYGRVTLEEVSRDIVIVTKDDRIAVDQALFMVPRYMIDEMKIKDVLAREVTGWGHPVYNETDVAYYSELANLYPSIELFNKNIRTTYNDTEGCYQDGTVIDGKCEIRIDYTHLDEHNKMVADTLIETGNAVLVEERDYNGNVCRTDMSIYVPCDGEETIEEVNERMFALIKGFAKQDVLHGLKSYEAVYKELMFHTKMNCSEEEGQRIRDIIGDDPCVLRMVLAVREAGMDYLYDANKNMFWINTEYYRRHAEFEGIDLSKNRRTQW